MSFPSCCDVGKVPYPEKNKACVTLQGNLLGYSYNPR